MLGVKTSKEELLDAISADLIAYLKSGVFSPRPFLNKINLNIDRIEDLIKIHFLLDEKVKDYILNLPQMIRRLTVSTDLYQETGRDRIKGAIDWSKTMFQRLNTYYKDKTLFSYRERDKLYNTKENIVLKKFIEVLYNIIFVEVKMERFVNYEWYREGYEINRIIKEIYEKNIYLSRINIEGIKVSHRMIEDVAKNRNKLYKEAAELLRKYKRLVNFVDEGEVIDLFRNTFVEIVNENVLFELYWVIRLIKDNTSNAKMHIVDGGNNKVASWEQGNFLYNVYHNSTGSGRLIFRIDFEEVKNIENEYFRRSIEVAKNTSRIAAKLFEDNSAFLSDSLWSGRPDILVEVVDRNTGKIKKIIIGEVKYTTDRDYMIQGLKELLEYVYYIKEKSIKGMYVFDNPQSEIEVGGILFVDDIKFLFLEGEIVNVYKTSDKNILLQSI